MRSGSHSLIQADASLRRFNTFGVDVRARWLVRLRSAPMLPEVLARPDWRGLPVLVLGEGSNILFRHDVDGVVLKLDGQRVERLSEDAEAVVVRAEAGRHWHDFVLWTLRHDLPGLENLALIPGTVGAAPVQNIGAYGVELNRFVHAVECFDPATGTFALVPGADCGFGYRHSAFKPGGARAGQAIVAVHFRLPRRWEPVLHYPGVREELVAAAADPTPMAIAEAICRIRRRKLPDPAQIGNAGSFFKNPVLDAERAAALARDNPGLPSYPAGPGRTKLAAAWLIERCGLKGFRDGDAGIAPGHALVLVNHGHASGDQLWAVAQRVRQAVEERFGVLLEPEPTIV